MSTILGSVLVLVAVGLLVKLALLSYNPVGQSSQQQSQTGSTTTQTSVTTFSPWNQFKTWSQKEWVQVLIGIGIDLLLLLILDRQLFWWFSGQHPRLCLGLILLTVLAFVVLEKNYKRTKKIIWRVGVVIVLLCGLIKAELKDYRNNDTTIGQAVVTAEQRQEIKEIAQNNLPNISLPSFTSANPNTASATETSQTYTIFPGQWTHVRLPFGINKVSFDGGVGIADMDWSPLYCGGFNPSISLPDRSEYLVMSLDITKNYTVTHGG